ncbi:hypothetical protein LCI18_010623 [Fusarium solani-melongenae]|uniref:Uncharacterized protein n=1 Tax=Fusarium solani subsp. cucurbitae TaxID=2747967 RepID=A0ACD3ZF29_FUSSC|nr:hypothetical protein LCI18_010623 [Fusarium solani-melongenae]
MPKSKQWEFSESLLISLQDLRAAENNREQVGYFNANSYFGSEAKSLSLTIPTLGSDIVESAQSPSITPRIELVFSPQQDEIGFTYKGNGLVPIKQDNDYPLPDLLRYYQIIGEDGRYWTDKLLRHILTRDRVQHELEGSEYAFKDIDDLVNKVRPLEGSIQSESYLKVFALLLLQDRVEDLELFIKDTVCDEKLPIILEKARRGYRVYSSKDPSKLLECFKNWRSGEQEGFEANQWNVLTTFFGLTEEKTCKDDRVLHASGGYGTVTRVEFHPTSHSFQDALSELKRFSGAVHSHLVTTLGAFKHSDEWNFIFPGAHCDLDEYLEQHDSSWTHGAVDWAFKQLLGITGALDTIHNPRHLHLSPDIEKRYGRHGDIKCDNILCFPVPGRSHQYHLIISDFGISAFNRDTSRSNIPNEKVPGVPGYRPPECDVTGGEISRSFDIWCLGCLFLEFITWVLGGRALLEDFRRQRLTTYLITGVNNNIFYVLKRTEKGGYVAQVKPEVTEWIQRLRRHENCSQLIHDVLDLIQHEMLVVLEDKRKKAPIGSTVKRSSSGELKNKLDRIQRKCTETYCTKGLPRDDEKPLLAPAVEVELNSVAKFSISQQYKAVGKQEDRSSRGNN